MRTTALSTTHPRAASQADDMSIGQLFDLANHYAQERHDELNSIMLTILFKNRWQARCNLHATFSPPLTRTYSPPCPSTRHRIRLSRTRTRHARIRTLAAYTMRALYMCEPCDFWRACDLSHTAERRDTALGRESPPRRKRAVTRLVLSHSEPSRAVPSLPEPF